GQKRIGAAGPLDLQLLALARPPRQRRRPAPGTRMVRPLEPLRVVGVARALVRPSGRRAEERVGALAAGPPVARYRHILRRHATTGPGEERVVPAALRQTARLLLVPTPGR